MSAGGLDTVSSPAFTDEETQRFHAAGWWSESTLSDAVRRHARQSPDRLAYVDDPGLTLTWREFDSAASGLADRLAGAGVGRGDRVAVWHRDCAAIHVLFVAIERCGAVVVGIGARAGTREVAAILRSAQPKMLISDEHRSAAATRAASDGSGDSPVTTLVLGRGADPLSLDTDAKPRALGIESQLGPDDVFLINSTSGTTGLPKCVVHTENRWHYFHQQAVANGLLVPGDVFLPVIPTPFGFGLWTSHTTPIYLGATALVPGRPPPVRPYEQRVELPACRRRILTSSGTWQEAELVHRSQLQADSMVFGPFLVEAPDSTTYVPPGCRLEVDRSGCLVLNLSGTGS